MLLPAERVQSFAERARHLRGKNFPALESGAAGQGWTLNPSPPPAAEHPGLLQRKKNKKRREFV